MAETILVASGKGGVGKTTLSAHLAAGFARLGKRALVLEADAGFRGLDLLLGLPGETVFDLGDAADGRCPPADAVRRAEGAGVDFLPAPADPAWLPSPQGLARLLGWAAGEYDWVIADCAGGFGPLTRLLARQAGGAVLLTLPDEVSARGAARVSALLRQEGVERQRLVIDRIPRRFVPTARVRDLDDIIDLAGVRLLGAVPEEPGLPPPGPVPGDSPAGRELAAIPRRLLGEEVPLVLFP